MIYTVTWNPSLDYVVYVDQYRTGAVNRSGREELYAGGKGINVSIVLKQMGIESVALGFLAGFTGQEIQRQLQEQGLTTDFLWAKEGYSRINVKLKSNQETEINGQGPMVTPEDVRNLERKLESLTQEDYLVLAGRLPDSMEDDWYGRIMEKLADRKPKIIVDATGAQLLQVIACHPFLIKPNHHELGELFGTVIHDRQEIVECAVRLQDKGARNILVSMAGEGAILVTETGEVYQAEAPRGKVMNSVGAGDSMVAGFLTGYLKEHNMKEAFYTGLCTGSASAFSKTLAKKEEVEELLKQYRL